MAVFGAIFSFIMLLQVDLVVAGIAALMTGVGAAFYGIVTRSGG